MDHHASIGVFLQQEDRHIVVSDDTADDSVQLDNLAGITGNLVGGNRGGLRKLRAVICFRSGKC